MNAEQRFHALDAVRAFALIGGIVLHGTMSFLPDFTSLGVPIADSSPSLTLEVVFYVLHVFRMSAFFLIAGFFAHMMFHRKGLAAFVGDRMKRILAPLVVFYIALMPIIIVPILWAVSKNGGGLQSMGSGENPGPPLTHLWFLYYLVIFYALVLIGRQTLVLLDRQGWLRNAADRAMRALVNSNAALVVFALPTAASLYLTPGWVWVGIPTPEHGPMPEWHAVVSYGSAFTIGWLLHRQTTLLFTFERRWPLHLAIAVVATAAAWTLVGAPMPFDRPVPEGLKLWYAALYTLATWSWIFAILGLAMRYFSDASRVRRYLADASYWLYLVHVPIVFTLQAWMMDWAAHWSVKFPLLLAVTFAVLLASYHYCVRDTPIGKWLNGRRYPRETAGVVQGASVTT